MRVKAKFLATANINGSPVSFFTPPHDEPDFIWVDIYELACAFLPEDAASRMVNHAQNFDRENRAAETAAHDGKIRTIVSYPMARGMCGCIDQMNGNGKDDEDWGGGPCENDYIFASCDVQNDHHPLSFEETLSAFHNQGGPGLSSVRK